MQIRRFLPAAIVIVILAITVPAKGKKPIQTGWAEVVNDATDVRAGLLEGRKTLAHLGRGALVATYDTKHAGSSDWMQVRVANPATLELVTGWVQSSDLKMFPVERFPSDDDIEKILGGEYLLDVNTQHMQINRFLVGRASVEPLLAAYIGSTFMPQTRLQIFESKGGVWTAGPFVEFFSAQLKTGVAEIEIRDLLGDGNECILTHEPFAQTFGSSGVNLVIRRIEADKFKTLWQAPLEVRNLSAYPPKVTALDPPEKNIGAPGTVSKGSVEYQRQGQVDEPLWKGKVDFYIPGREAPVKTVSVEKICHWGGSVFAPLN